MSSLNLDPLQEKAIGLIEHARIGVITGGPGTGKTTCLVEAIERLERHGVNFALAAPTGKAARRMSEVTGQEALTIHRLLKSRGLDRFDHDHFNPLPYQLVIVDEASMVDVFLSHNLMAAIGKSTRLVLIGDANQLPSVGPGRIFGDLISSNAVPVVRLQTVHRAAAESWVCRNAPKILEGKMPEIDNDLPDFNFYEADDTSEAVKIITDLSAANPDMQLLVPQRTGSVGANVLNPSIQDAVNGDRPKMHIGKEPHKIHLGDRVIQTRNNYQLFVMNGEVGTVTHMDAKATVVDFDYQEVQFDRLQSTSLELAYALTIHKSQGSEWDDVLVVCHSTHSYMLTRRLIYTAITRAKKSVTIVGDEQGLHRAVNNNRERLRHTSLVERITGAQA